MARIKVVLGERESRIYLFYEIMVVVLLDTGEGNSRGQGGTGEGS